MELPFIHEGANYRLDEAAVSRREGMLRSNDYDDLYFGTHDALAECRHVFIDGSDLIKKLSIHRHLTIAETGFGTGLNFLAVLDLLDEFPDCQIDFISFESRPLSGAIMAESHAAFPTLALDSADLLNNMPPRWPGLHLRHFKNGRVHLHLIYGLAEDYLSQTDFLADIWFLDGFAPAKNPDIWTDKVLAHIGRLTQVGGTLASFTASSAVRRRLGEAGFLITKQPGFGHKREMIKGVKTGDKTNVVPRYETLQAVGIIGGGIAGASVAAGLRHRGIEAIILDAGSGLATAASGNRLALQAPRLSVDHNDISQLSASCTAYAAHCSDRASATVANKVVSLDWPDRETSRQDKFRRQKWPNDLLRAADANEVARCAGMPLAIGGIVHDYGRVINPSRLCHYLAAGIRTIFNAKVIRISRSDTSIILHLNDGRQFEFNRIVVATGAHLLETLGQLAVGGVRVEINSGQVSYIPEQQGLMNLRAGLSFGGYLTPSHKGFHELGATFDKSGYDDYALDAFIRNRNLLPTALKDLLNHLDNCSGRASRRASTPDRNPVMGRLDDGIYVLGAVGSRGFTLAPLLGEYLAAQITGTPNCLSRRIQAALDPFRFRSRRGS